MQLLHASAGTGRCMQCLWIRQSKQPDAAILSARGNLPEAAYYTGCVLGEGGFGITYLGWDQTLSIPVAIKEYYPRDLYEETRCGLILR